MQLERSNPEIIGSFRLIFAEPVRLSSLSEIQPPKMMPTAAAGEGPVAKKTYMKPR